jgi:hypothetical protein
MKKFLKLVFFLKKFFSTLNFKLKNPKELFHKLMKSICLLKSFEKKFKKFNYFSIKYQVDQFLFENIFILFDYF